MKRFLLTGFKFLLFLIPLYVVVIFLIEIIFPPLYKPNLIYNPELGFLSNRIDNLKQNYQEVDILFLGSSKAYRSFDTRKFSEYGYHSFNLGSSAQTHLQTNFLIKEYVSQLNPKLIIYEVYPDTFLGKGVESGLNIVSAAEKVNLNLLQLVVNMNDIKIYNTYLIKIFRELIGLSPSIKTSTFSDVYIDGGFVSHQFKNDSIIELTPLNWKPNDIQVKKFEDNLELIKRNNIPYLLVLAPYNRQYENLGYIESFFQKRGDFMNFNAILNFSISEHFYDGQHLNQEAAEKFSIALIRVIEAKKLIP